MTKRERLEEKKKKNFDKIEALRQQNIELYKELCLLSDKKQWFTEMEEECTVSVRPKKTETHLIGRIHWNEFFMDQGFPDDESKGIWVLRQRIVRVDGEWR